MIDKLKGFPNQAIPSIFDESLSYTQQVAYLMFKLQETIDVVNSLQSQGLPSVTDADNGKIAEVVEGEWMPTESLITLKTIVNQLSSTVLGQTVDIRVLQGQMDSLYDDIITLGASLREIVQGQVEED